MNLNHIPVLLNESINGLNIKTNGIYIDGTVGGGGHSFFIAQKIFSDEKSKLICIDRDEFALSMAKQKLKPFEKKIIFVHDNFCNIKKIAEENKICGVDGILLDLGVSSFQLDDVERGFSYIKNARLDMRMDRNQKFTAFDLVNKSDIKKLGFIIKTYGEEKFYKQIANKICRTAKIKSIETTLELVEIIKSAIPKKFHGKGNPAKKTFQAIRIAVNNEIEILEQALKDCINLLNKDGRLCVISFHSLEDRIVKNIFREFSTGCTCPKDFPICVCKKNAVCEIINKKPICAGKNEIDINSRAHSAKLRIIKKI